MPRYKVYTKEWLEDLCKNSYSYAEVLKQTGRAQSGGNQSHLKKKIQEFNIDISHFTGQRWNKGRTKSVDSRVFGEEKYKIDEIFVENSSVSRKTIRGYVVRNNLLQYQCQMCGNTGEWLNKTIALHLDHINGVPADNRLENLRWLCPNCHATTDTYGIKNTNNGHE